MVVKSKDDVAERARKIFESELRAKLEKSSMGMYVAIEPVSGEYFLGETLSVAIGAARTKFPDRLVHALRVGRRAAIEFGLRVQ